MHHNYNNYLDNIKELTHQPTVSNINIPQISAVQRKDARTVCNIVLLSQ